MDIAFVENGLHLHVQVSEAGDVRLLGFGARAIPAPGEETASYRLVELQESGLDQDGSHGSKHTGTLPGKCLRYRAHHDTRNGFGRKLEIVQEADGLFVTSHLQFYDGIPVARSWTAVENRSERERPLEYVSSFALTGLSQGSCAARDEDGVVHLPHSTWYGEAQWKSYPLRALGYDVVNDASMKRIRLSSTGSWPASEHLPMGGYENTTLHTMLLWQIETTASWNWEISDISKQLYLQVSGPSYQENNFLRMLRPGETFESVPCAVAAVQGGVQDAARAMTQYRRAIRRPNHDNAHPAVIFNDYMNCLMGDPTTEKLLPLIDAAAKAGCAYFCIDCGWYDDGPWWEGVGEWLPSKARFPNGIEEPLRYIRRKGMIPGLWLELEVMGVQCPLAAKVPKDWFFQRNGRPVIDHGRYQLDFRNPQVIAHADRVVRRLVEEYGVGYIKMDYNINAGPGTQLHADSPGAGLLAHTRAYLKWLDSVFARWPDLVVENCSSGGMRMEYSLLSRCSIQSVTDQTDYLKMAAIACNCATAVTPEQAAIWSYPLCDGDEEETAFNMVNAMLFRIHQSGHLAQLSAPRLALVQQGIRVHKQICERLTRSLPFWPIGLAQMSDNFLCVGLDCRRERFLAVWCIREAGEIAIPVAGDAADCLYPSGLPTAFAFSDNTLTVQMQARTARLFHIIDAKEKQ